MPRLVSLSRAAKLVGISRGELQKRVHDLELESFEGQVKLDDIEKMFPDAELEDNHIIEELERIVEQALKKARGEKLIKLLTPDTHTLAARLQSITKDHATSKNQVREYIAFIAEIQNRILGIAETSKQPELFNELNVWMTESIAKIKSNVSKPSPLLEKDTILRIIAPQVHIKDTGHEFFVEGSSTILEAGLSAGLSLNYGCSNGNCGKCKAKLVSGKIKKIKPHDFVFSESDKLQNYFLCCSNTAITEIEIEAEEAGSEKDIPQQSISAKVKRLDKISNDVLILNLRTPRTKRLRFLAGQNASLQISNLPLIEIPIASCPCGDMNIQFHIPKENNSPLSHYIYKELKNADSIKIKGPKGSFLLDEDSNNPIIFIAIDTGFAPIKSLLEHAVTLEHAESIHLYWMHSNEKPYMHNQCRAWEDALDNFSYQHIKCDSSDTLNTGEYLKLLLDKYSDFSEYNIYICGEEQMIKASKKILIKNNADKKHLKIQAL